jgi:hypothetical protein
MRNTYLSNYYFKTKQRRGSKKAIVALSRKILVIIYHLLKNKDVYNEEKFELSKQKQESLRLKRITNEAKKMGYLLMPADVLHEYDISSFCSAVQ